MERKNLDRKRAMNWSAAGLFTLAAVLVAITLIMGTKTMDGTYKEFLDVLLKLEDKIIVLPYKWLIIVAILLFFLLKNFIPVPTPFICLMTGMVFDTKYSIIINTIGFSMLLTTKYWWGRASGGGTAIKTLKKYDNVREMMDKAGPGKLACLVAFRLIPSIPVNPISKIYGGMKFPYWRFMLASLIGFFPKIWSYSYMGGNIFHPFTWNFMAPIVALLVISGTSTLVVNVILEKRKGEDKHGKHQRA